MNPRTHKWTPMLGVWVPKCRNPTLEEWKDDSLPPKMGTRESPETPKISEFDRKGQNTSHCDVFYIIEKLPKCKCRKWARMNHLDICRTNYDKKKGRESNWQFDSRPPKVRNRPNLGVCRWSATHRWKAFDEGYNFSLDLIAIGGLHRTLCALKLVRVLTIGISGFALVSLGTKSHLNVAPMESYIVYYKGEGGGFPQVRAVVSLVCPSCPWLVLAPKMLQLCTNHFVLVLCRSVWVSEACDFFLVLSWSSSTPLYPSIVLRAKECAPTPCFPLFFSLGLTFEPFKEIIS
jgi:hypothetical protein